MQASDTSRTCDVAVIGTGAAGMTAAILAHDGGANVLLLERSDRVGGTTAVSGGGVWAPMNDHMQELGVADSREEALGYCLALTMGRAEDDLVAAYVDTAAEMTRYMEQHTPVKFSPVSAPDYQPEVPGGKMGGRTLEPVPFDTSVLGEWKDKLRGPSSLPFPITLQEVFQSYQAYYQPWKIPQDLVAERMMKGVVCLGQALAASLLRGVLDRKIPIVLNARARHLVVDTQRVTGLVAEADGGKLTVHARAGVVLASGGFEWNEELKKRFLPGEVTAPNSPPLADGDALEMAMEVGTDLANMSEVWNYPSIQIPGETYDGKPLSRGIKAERSGPHVIWVNRRGQRFVNEAANYNSVGKAFYQMEANGPEMRNMPAWAVMDSQYRERYVIGTTMPGDPDPQYLVRAETLTELAAKLGVDAEGLQETVARWNRFCAEGRDRDFDRGTSKFDQYQGDHTAPMPNLGSIAKAPFYAMPLHAGCLGTKGGPRINANAQVMRVDGTPFEGLYAAGNACASVAGPSYWGPGSTLGPAMTWGYAAGRHAAARAKR